MDEAHEYLEQFQEHYKKSTEKLGEINRSLIFAGIAIIWIFKASSSDNELASNSIEVSFLLPNDLYLPLILFSSSLLLEMIQYAISSINMARFIKGANKKLDKEEPIVEYHRNNEKIVMFFFWSKLIVSFIGYIFLITYLSINIKLM